MEFIPTEEALQFIHQKDKKNKAFFEELEGSYYTEKEEELEEAKRLIIRQIAQNPIKFVDIQRLGYYIQDIIYNNE